MRTNYHSHTFRCRHAGTFSDEEYILAAIEAGYAVYGVSDHVPWPFRDGLQQTTRMETSEFPEYVRSIRALEETYRGQIEIRLGLECDGFLSCIDHLRTLQKSVDYLILGHHYLSDDLENTTYLGGKKVTSAHLDLYAGDVVRAMESGLFCCLAHPDLPFAHYPVWDAHCENVAHTVCRAAEALDLPLEYNVLGVLKRELSKFTGLGYPCDRFWQIAKQYRIRAVVGVDAHNPAHVLETARYDDACAQLDALGIRRMERLF